MDLDELKNCKDENEYSTLIMGDVLSGYSDKSVFPDHRLIAIVDHAADYSLEQIKSFFEIVQSELAVRFWVGDATSITIDGRGFYRYSLYSDEQPLKNILFHDRIYRMQKPVINRTDGIVIDMKGLTVTFKNDGEVLQYGSLAELNKAVIKILDEYWPDTDRPDISIVDSISEYPRTRWMVESISDHMLTLITQKDRIRLAKRIERLIPDLKFQFSQDAFVSLTAAWQLAGHMSRFDPGVQHEIISKIILNFGFFDDYPVPEA